MVDAPRNGKRALIVGLGISGMATAIRLHQIGWTPVIVERAPARRTGGNFVIVFGSGRAAATRLGITAHLRDRRPTGASYECNRKGARRVGANFTDLPGGAWMVLRGDVEAAAFQALPDDVEIRYSTVPMKIDQHAGGVSVALSNLEDSTVHNEEFDLVVGADGLRSTVRKLAFGPDENYLRRLNHIVATFEMPKKISDLAVEDGAWQIESGRSLIVYPMHERMPTAQLSYRTDDVDEEFTEPPAVRLRKAFGSRPYGRLLAEVLDAFDSADQYLFDSVEQVHMDSWHHARVVLVGDAAWCETMYSGLGVSSALAGPDLLGTMLDRHPTDLKTAFAEWDRVLRPFIDAYQSFGLKQRFFFTPESRTELLMRRGLARLVQTPFTRTLLTHLTRSSKAARLKDQDIAAGV
ncbi:FAD-dependent oxidoreductase [Mycobacterium sp. CBMA271]|nr:FAD-dependent oxidoreductase [Mycobacteroides sp. CBMA 326]MUM23937.1 FAD-dependent oxidoreductase [Mycobacteroides sp. CBMA 271]